MFTLHVTHEHDPYFERSETLEGLSADQAAIEVEDRTGVSFSVIREDLDGEWEGGSISYSGEDSGAVVEVERELVGAASPDGEPLSSASEATA